MNFKYIIYSALKAIAEHKVRSFLTVLGILIGVMSIIAVMSIGSGATKLILGELDYLGSNMVMVVPGDLTSDRAMMDVFFADLLSESDLTAIKRPANVPNLSEVMPGVLVPGVISHYNSNYRQAITLGAEADFFGLTFNVYPTEGQNFTEGDVLARAKVAIIGSKVKEELFGLSDALGENLTIGGTRFRIVGVYPQIGQRGPFNIDNLVLIPHTTASTYILGHNQFDRFLIRADDSENVDRLAFDLSATLRETRNIGPGEEDDFTVMTQQALRDQITKVMNILTAFLIFVVSIALLVGGIGIMNIMLVSVTERTREIGLRKALGATNRDILRQFLWESIILTLLGGIIGMILGGGISFVTSLILANVLNLTWPFVFPFSALVLGLGMSATVGLIFGLYPARQAAKMDPIDALRYE